MIWQDIAAIGSCNVRSSCHLVAWPSGLRRWFKAPVSAGAWVPIPLLPLLLDQYLLVVKVSFFRWTAL